jgi:hypothetical protein
METYINVDQGRNIKPKIGQRADSKATPTHLAGWIIHQIMPAKRGPKNTKTVKKQHMGISLLREKVGQVSELANGDHLRQANRELTRISLTKVDPNRMIAEIT